MVARAATALLALSTVAVPLGPAAAQAPSAEELTAGRQEAERLRGEVAGREGDVARARAELDVLSAAAGAALEDYAVAVAAQADAEADHWEQSERLDAARTALDASRDDLGRWAARTYREGGELGGYAGVLTLLEARSTDDLGHRLSMLRTLGRAQGGHVRASRDAEQAQTDAVAAAAGTARLVGQAVAQAENARVVSEARVAEHRAQVRSLEALLAQSRDAAADADARAAQLAQARAAVEQGTAPSSVPTGLEGLNAVTGETGSCAGGDVQRYPNGQIPREALCPVWAAPGHLLRADAAFAADRLADAYAAAFGEPLCVTDSYRTLASQHRLYATKPHLAARPGTSNHGWGTALDLCGGVQRFGTPQHRWLQLNAPLHGWFHPRWAQEGGSRPEPWHWEFAG